MIAFSGTPELGEQRFEMYMLDDDGNNLRRLTSKSHHDCNRPTWSPDGRHLLFRAHSRQQALDLPAESHLITIASGKIHRLTRHTTEAHIRFAHWLPDGRIALEVPNGWYVAALDPDQPGRTTPLPCREDVQRSYNVLARSPDREKLLLVRQQAGNRAYALSNADGSDLQPLHDDGIPRREFSWSPDGQRIAFIRRHEDQDTLCVMQTDWSNVCPIDEIATHGNFTWSPDGQHIAFLGYGRRGYALLLAAVNTPGAPPRMLLGEGQDTGDFSTQRPCWSPDGQQIGFSTYIQSGCHIYTIDVANGTRRHLTGAAPAFAVIHDLAWGARGA